MSLVLATDDTGGPEIFASLQGEGPSAGMPVAFIRLSRCNLACVWCDTAYTWRFDGDNRPHRDDVELLISQRPARTHASQGETWSLALALRLATALWLRSELSSGDPIIILDDVFAELDATRRAKLVGLVGDYEQLLITSAVEEDLPAGLSGAVLDVSHGVVTPR
jgi:recombinational DNA repair ATPase RecF